MFAKADIKEGAEAATVFMVGAGAIAAVVEKAADAEIGDARVVIDEYGSARDICRDVKVDLVVGSKIVGWIV